MDNAREFLAHDLMKWLFKSGVDIEPCAPHKHGQNGVAERNGRTVKEHANAAMLDSDLPASFWDECMDSFAYCWNRFPASKTGDLSPYELYLPRAAAASGMPGNHNHHGVGLQKREDVAFVTEVGDGGQWWSAR